MKDQLIEFYRDWVNNFISTEGIAQHYGITSVEAEQLIEIGKKYHEGNLKIEHGSRVVSVDNIWHNLVKAGHHGQVVKVLETGFNVFFPLSGPYKYEDQIFFCEPNQIKLS